MQNGIGFIFVQGGDVRGVTGVVEIDMGLENVPKHLREVVQSCEENGGEGGEARGDAGGVPRLTVDLTECDSFALLEDPRILPPGGGQVVGCAAPSRPITPSRAPIISHRTSRL